MLKGFRDFLMRGNVIELAVAVVIGLAFQAVINIFVTAIVKPIVAAFPGSAPEGWGFSLRGGSLKKSTFIDFSAVINALIVFVITAAVVYFVFVLPMNKFNERRRRGLEPEAEVKPDDVLLLEEIRDLLRTQATLQIQSTGRGTMHGPGSS